MALGNGNDQLILGNGADTVTLGSGTYNVMAGSGSDAFVFTAPQGQLTMAFDSNDELVFSSLAFALGGGPSGPGANPPGPGGPPGPSTSTPQPIAAALFSPNSNGTFATAANRFAYNQSTGDLYYDAQGSASPSSAQLIADLTNKPHLTAASLFFTS